MGFFLKNLVETGLRPKTNAFEGDPNFLNHGFSLKKAVLCSGAIR